MLLNVTNLSWSSTPSSSPLIAKTNVGGLLCLLQHSLPFSSVFFSPPHYILTCLITRDLHTCVPRDITLHHDMCLLENTKHTSVFSSSKCSCDSQVYRILIRSSYTPGTQNSKKEKCRDCSCVQTVFLLVFVVPRTLVDSFVHHLRPTVQSENSTYLYWGGLRHHLPRLNTITIPLTYLLTQTWIPREIER